MEQALICNNMKCRRELVDRALVTTCRHIFCLNCAQGMGAPGQETGQRTMCLACHCQLNTPDDAIVSNLTPSEEYKTSVLSGLSPNVIMECAGRALSFWAYQSSQDNFYRQHLYKTLADKYSNLSLQLEKTVHDANSEIEALQQKMTSMAVEHDALRRKNQEIAHGYREKSRMLLQAQELYDKVKHKAEMGPLQQAASEAVDSSIPMVPPTSYRLEGIAEHDPAESNIASTFGQAYRTNSMNTGQLRSCNSLPRDDGRWPQADGGFNSQTSYIPMGGLRRPVLGSTSLLNGTSLPGLAGAATHGSGMRRRSPGTNSPSFVNNRVGLAGVGLTSRLKISQPTNAPRLGSFGATSLNNETERGNNCQ